MTAAEQSVSASDLRACFLDPSHGDMVWTRSGHRDDFEVYLTDHDGCTIFFQKGKKGWERTIENASIEDVKNVIKVYLKAKKK